MSKQDKTASRTATDVERKYNFGKTFAEVFGLADDAKRAAEKAQEAADNATEAVEDLDQDAIFNLLTDNGALKGLFMKDGQLYINASYLATGVIKSENGKLEIDLSGATEPTFNTGISTNGLVIRGDAADAEKLISAGVVVGDDGKYYGQFKLFSTTGTQLINLTESVSGTEREGAMIALYDQNGAKRVWVYSSDDQSSGVQLFNGNMVGTFQVNPAGNPVLQLNDSNGKKAAILNAVNGLPELEFYNAAKNRVVFIDVNSYGGDLTVTNADNSRAARLVDGGINMGLWLSAGGSSKGSFLADSSGSTLTTTKINGKTVSWKDNGDGTYTLIGR